MYRTIAITIFFARIPKQLTNDLFPSKKLYMPQSNAKSITEQKDPVVVSVDRDGNYFLAIEAGSNEAVDTASLQAKVRALVANNPDLAVYVAADGAGSYQNVMDAMALLQNAGVEKVGLMSQPRQDGTP